MSFDRFETYEHNLHKRRASEPARAYLWAVELPDLRVDPSNGGDSASFRRAKEDEKRNNVYPYDLSLVNASVTSITTPFFNFDTDKVVDGGRFWYKAKHNEISNISITFEEQMDGSIWNYLMSWKNLILSTNGGQNPPSFYKRDIVFLRLDMSKLTFQKFIYKNFFISEVSQISNEYTSNSAVQYTATFTGDAMITDDRLSGTELQQRLELVSERMGGIEIPYDPFKYSGIPSPTISNLLSTIASRSLY